MVIYRPSHPLLRNKHKMSAPTRQLSRHITQDGRNSLRQHLFGPRAGGATPVGVWARIMKKETYPLLAAVGGGIALAGWFATRHLFTNPDVQLDKVRRQQR